MQYEELIEMINKSEFYFKITVGAVNLRIPPTLSLSIFDTEGQIN